MVNPLNPQDPMRPESGRSAADYANAANAVIDIAELAVSLLPGGGAVAQAAKRAIRYAPIARVAVKKLPDIAPVAKRAGEVLHDKVPGVVGAGAAKVHGAVKGVASVAGEKGRAAGDALKKAFDPRDQDAARLAARSALLDGATIRMSAEQFMRAWSLGESDDGAQDDGAYLDFGGCYAIATYPSAVKKGDFGTFRDVYVGKSKNMGAAIHADMVGRGNADVYADVKYKQHVYVLLFPCAAEKLDELEASLITALDADASYNRER